MAMRRNKAAADSNPVSSTSSGVSKNSRKKSVPDLVPNNLDAGVGSIRLDDRMKFRSPLILTLLVLVCLTPFLGKAFHIDDPLFVWAGKQIAQHPGNPYGFT